MVIYKEIFSLIKEGKVRLGCEKPGDFDQPEGVEILSKYQGQLPKMSNQRLNAYLKELQTITGISKTLHTHLFRKTYGTRLLNRHVRLETVSKCLGHSNTQITQQAYAKLLKETIIKEVSKVF